MRHAVVIDFDYTLFDAARFKAAMAASLTSCGVDAAAFWETYGQVSAGTDKICDYDPRRHVATLAPLLTCPPDEALRRIDTVTDRASEFLIPGAVRFLERLKPDVTELVLLTHGDPDWQKRKVESSGLLPHFTRAIYSAKNKEKAEELSALPAGTVMVNDNGREIDAIQKAFPDFRMIAVRGPKAPPSDPSVPVCSDLEEVYKRVVGALQ